MRMNVLHWLMMVVITSFIPATWGNTEGPPEDVPPARWVVRPDRRQWHAAAFACRRLDNNGGDGGGDGGGVGGGDGGGELAVPHSREEARAMASLIVEAFPDPTDAAWAYVGLNDLAEEGEFATEDGHQLWQMNYTRWHSWNAFGGPDDHCVALDRFGLYWDVPCDWHLPFICALPPPRPPASTPCPPVSGEATVDDADGDKPRAPDETSVGDYTLERVALNWWGALAACARSGRRLALPRSAYDMENLRNLLTAVDDEPRWTAASRRAKGKNKKKKGEAKGQAQAAAEARVRHERPPGGYSGAYVGVSDLARAGRYRTVLGELFDLDEKDLRREPGNSTPDPDEITPDMEEGAEDPPEALGGSSCLVVNQRGVFELTGCSTQLPFFCEELPIDPSLEEPTPCPTPIPPPPDPDTIPPPPGHFWLMRGDDSGGPSTWDQAARICLGEGSVLAVPETTAEATALADFLRSVPTPSDENTGADVWAYVGIRDFQNNGNFSTIFGSNMSEGARGAEWGPGQPNGNGEQPCVVLDRAATLWDVPCTWRLGFFCRRFPSEPPWYTFGRDDSGAGWKVDSTEMRRWLREMKALGAGSALASLEEDEEEEEGEEQQPLDPHSIKETARGFAHVDLRAWIDSFRYGTLSDYAPFEFNERRRPNAVRT